LGSPPKLHGHEIVQLQLSATVAVMCQAGAAACGGAIRATNRMDAATRQVRMGGRVYRPEGGVNRKAAARNRFAHGTIPCEPLDGA
jgi:hypothetical protein